MFFPSFLSHMLFKLINAIHLKNEIGVFTYYINNINTFSPLRIQINELYFSEDTYLFNILK